jgi:3D (Asp-Asp-Asp) domain-containing protein
MKKINVRQKQLVCILLCGYCLLLTIGAISVGALYFKRTAKEATPKETTSLTSVPEEKEENSSKITQSSPNVEGKSIATTPRKNVIKDQSIRIDKPKEKMVSKPQTGPTEKTPKPKKLVKPKQKENHPNNELKKPQALLSKTKEKEDEPTENDGTNKPTQISQKLGSLFAWIRKDPVKEKNKEQEPVLKPKKEPKPTKLVTRKEHDTKNTTSKTKKILARVTVYWAYGSGTDKWSANKQSSTGTKLECGKHAAVDPKVIPYGSKLEVQKNGQDVLVKAVDTGSAVKKRKAAIAMAKNEQQRKAPVIDLFFERKTDALKYAKSNPAYQWVDVHLPN